MNRHQFGFSFKDNLNSPPKHDINQIYPKVYSDKDEFESEDVSYNNANEDISISKQ